MADSILESYLADVRADPHKLRKFVIEPGRCHIVQRTFKEVIEEIKLLPSLFIIEMYPNRLYVECDHATWCELLTIDGAAVAFILEK